MTHENNLRFLPSIDALLRTNQARELTEEVGRDRLAELARETIDELRGELRANSEPKPDEGARRAHLLNFAAQRLAHRAEAERGRALRRVINTTGVVLHTNLGRAPLSAAARRAVAEQAAGYCTLEYDLATGKRGRRAPRVEELLTGITGAEAAMVVNNCAAATVLVLSALARGGESIVSRGELVEIGGDFRVPDVMRESGTAMVEVGTTNRTRVADYESAITPATRLIVRVHPSNYRIIGFTHAPTVGELAALAHKHDLHLYEDAGSGALFDLSAYGINDEPIIPQSISDGAGIVSFSGDKLLGGAQAGIIVGRSELIEQIRRAPLARALRADKLVLAALEATLEAYRRGTALGEVPALRMLSANYEATLQRTQDFVEKLHAECKLLCEQAADTLTGTVVEDVSAVGGGSAPLAQLRTAAIRLQHSRLSATELEAALRGSQPPIIARVVDDAVVLNLRTVAPEEDSELLAALKCTCRTSASDFQFNNR